MIDLDDFHQGILTEAAERANKDPRLAKLVPGVPEVFAEGNNRSGPDRLTLIILDGALNGQDDSVHTELAKIATEALTQTLVENREKFVGVIVGSARSGRNYFERYEEA